ncbi:hypothetical protein [Alkalicoccus luteus]|uniref:Uncharacterized protein n=1 Tax=Alkalicoccus luteus TaxID=1237094 RepID=A0A969PX19_9BACI|nr:hypothetical protein [Alkalicoccus luteus]NJP37202.1 hypothetical protein [Alkalicoccus luteus]
MMLRIQIYCDVDENGDITESVSGQRIVPDRQYDYFFMVEDQEIPNHIEDYKVEDRQLVKK